MICSICLHDERQHVRHEEAVAGVSDKRELCLRCPGYVLVVSEDGDEVEGYPDGQAWHRFKEME